MSRTMLAVIGLCAWLAVAGRAQTFHVESPLSIEPAPPLQAFSPATNALARHLVSEPFQISRGFGWIDSEVLALFRTKVPVAEISDVNGKFNATDTVTDQTVPSRRLLFAGKTPGIWFIFYEQGGIGYHQNLVVFTREAKEPWRIAAAPSGFAKKTDFDGLKAAIEAQRFFEQPGHPSY